MTVAAMGPHRIASRIKLKEQSIRTKMLDVAAGLEGVIALGRGDPDFDTPAHIVEAGQKALGNGATHYTHPAGLPELREAISGFLKNDCGADYGTDEIVVTAGAQEAMFCAMLALIEPGDEVIVPSPGYNTYHQHIELAGGKVVILPLAFENDFALTAEAVEKVLTPRSRMICLINPSNPAGTVTPPEEVKKLAELAVARDLILVSDEIYSQLVYDGHTVLSPASLPGLKERTITINGFSKAYAMTGWRIGYFAAPRPLAAAMTEIHHGLAICAAAVSQHAALAALTGSQDCVAMMRDTYDERRRVTAAALDAMGIPYATPGGAFYIYAKVAATGMPASEFCMRLLKEGRVMLFPGTLYGDHTDEFVRLSLLQPKERLVEATDRMGRFVQQLAA